MTDKSENEDRLTGLNIGSERKTASANYTKFIRLMRLILPVLVTIIVALLFIIPELDKQAVEPMSKEELLPDTTTAKNELVNPRYESVDKDMQPFTITASKAAQDQKKPELVILEKPTADILMKDGSWVAAKSKNGIYEQNTEKLQLTGEVTLFHDDGYQLKSEEMRVNLKTQEAFSDRDVEAQGPEGTISALGLEAYGTNNILIFKGPAKLTLTSTESRFNLEKSLP